MQQEPTVIEGVVTRGRQLGRRLGFPTANMEVGREVTAEAGVYASEAEVNGRRYRAMSNLGSNPTVGGTPRHLEQHLIDLCVAVATQGDDLTGSGVEVGDDALGVNALRDAVARTIVEDIAENAEHIAMVLVIELEHFLQGWTAAVDV